MANDVFVVMYGSRVYGTNHENSDYDFIAVVKDKDKPVDFPLPKGDVLVFSEEEFGKRIEQHDVTALECLWLPEKNILNGAVKVDFSLNLGKLRDSFSATASNSWVKAKKKFLVEKDFNPYIGKKSAWHALRIIDFGIQIAKNGKIVDYGSRNFDYEKIIGFNSWEEINSEYKAVYNQLSSEFRLVAPKNTSGLKL